MDKYFSILILAVLIEALVTYFKELLFDFSAEVAVPILLGVFIAVVYGVDLPAQLSITTPVPFVGEVITGIIMARGSNYLYDLIGRFTNLGQEEKGE